MNVAELKPFQKKADLIVKVEEAGESRDVIIRRDNSTHKVTEFLVGDDSGSILLTLWDENIEKVEVGKTYKIENGYTTLFKNSIRLNVGKYGALEESSEEIGTVNTENNLSEQELGNE